MLKSCKENDLTLSTLEGKANQLLAQQRKNYQNTIEEFSGIKILLAFYELKKIYHKEN